jgi:hypothetical protein
MTSNRFQKKGTMSEMKADNIDIFPQHRPGRRKPTIADIINDCVKTGQSPKAIYATVRALYPEVTRATFRAALTAEVSRLTAKLNKDRRETDTLELLLKEVFEPIQAEFGDETLTLGQAAWIAADRGNELAKAFLAHRGSDEMEAFQRDFEAAVALDPYWEMREDGVVVRRPGAAHKSAEDLVAAYRAGRLIRAEMTMPIADLTDEIVRRALEGCGIDASSIDTSQLDETTHRLVTDALLQRASAHPRWEEIRGHLAWVGVREEIARECRERGLPMVEDEGPLS